MEFSYKEEIIKLKAFQSVFNQIKSIDPKMGKNIQLSLESAVKESHDLLMNARIKEELQLALIKEQINIQSQSSQYLNITDEITQQKNKLLEFKPKAYHEFMEEVETKVAGLMHSKKLAMYREIEKDGTWYSGLRDSGKKSGGALINATVKGINKLSKEFQGKQIIEKEKVVDSNSIVETVLEKHLNSEIVAKEISEILSKASKNYEKKWIEQISINIPNINRLSAYSISNLTKNNIRIDFQIGAAEQVLTMGLGSAVVGAVGLAAGWHTMTYAMLNVFPPVALFAATATVFVGVITKDKAVVKRKKEIDDAVNQYHHHFLLQLYSMKLQTLGNKSTSIYFEDMGNKIVDEAVRQWEENYFGDLNMDHFRMLNQAFVKHLLYVNEAMDELVSN
ncbi:hypothetical protein [Ureibacillus acetophenoni]|uniref:Uncharacterized protein n=1 Tax=Ureibacillus acetophenoni TaxID=614649 RepID=A0A285U5H1_9BACL|nr:hypothetical protein [Ureibacillus acetophenoni]SOC37082.1 hypothetical protein SAMN05877842_10313 [Ureibacillus acetophenoni]